MPLAWIERPDGVKYIEILQEVPDELNPYLQRFTGETFFRHKSPHERSDLSHWRLGSKLDLLWPRACARRMRPARGAPVTSSG